MSLSGILILVIVYRKFVVSSYELTIWNLYPFDYYKINDQTSIPVIGCLNQFTIEFTIENEQKIEFEFYI